MKLCLSEKEGIPGGSAKPDGGGQDEGGRGEEAGPDGAVAQPLRVEAPLGAAAADQRQEVAAAQVSTCSTCHIEKNFEVSRMMIRCRCLTKNSEEGSLKPNV